MANRTSGKSVRERVRERTGVRRSGSSQLWYHFSVPRDGRRWDELVALLDNLLSSIKLRNVSVQYIKYTIGDDDLSGIVRFNRRMYISYVKDVFPFFSVRSLSRKECRQLLKTFTGLPSFEMGSQCLSFHNYSRQGCQGKTTLSIHEEAPPLVDNDVSN